MNDMSRRIRRVGKSDYSKISTPREPEKSSSTMETEFADLKTKVDIIDARMKLMSDKLTPVDLTGIENKMNSLDKIDGINANLVFLKNEFHNLNMYAKLFFGFGLVALLLYCINGLISIMDYLRPVK